MNVARALRFHANLPLKFWGDYVLTAADLINRLPNPLLGNLTPYQKLLGHPPSYQHLKSFGCLCYASTLTRNKSKFDPRAKACIFLGYPFGTKGYKLYDLSNKNVFLSRDVIFKESVFPFKQWLPKFVPSSSSISHNMFPSQPSLPESIPSISAEFSLPFNPVDTAVPPDEILDLVHPDLDTSPPIPTAPPDFSNLAAPLLDLPVVRRSTRSHKPPSYLHDYHCNLASTTILNHHCNLASASLIPSHDSIDSPGILYPLSSTLSYSKLSNAHRAFSIALSIAKEPTLYAEALPDPLWQAAMKAKIDALQANKTWVMTKLPPGEVPIGYTKLSLELMAP